VKRSYELEEAKCLLPFLEAIVREIDERSVEIQGETRRLERLRTQGADDVAISNAVAALANHKRELRHAVEELEGLGCAAEVGLHTEIFIPGPDGRFESGYRLDLQGNLSDAEPAGAES
jgi:hypothetical protein